jgi:hypothetical protein
MLSLLTGLMSERMVAKSAERSAEEKLELEARKQHFFRQLGRAGLSVLRLLTFRDSLRLRLQEWIADYT